MGRLSCFLLVAFCVGAATVRGDDSWFPDPFDWDSPPPADAPPPPLYPAPGAPAPYYDAPPYTGGEPPVESSPPYDEPPVESPPPYNSYPPTDGPSPSPWLSSGLWAKNTDFWPRPWMADTPIEKAFGTDAVDVYGNISMMDGITSESSDGYSDLLKQGTAALFNSVDAHFKYTEDDIKKSFSFKTALSSEAAAKVRAKSFQDANEAFGSR